MHHGMLWPILVTLALSSLLAGCGDDRRPEPGRDGGGVDSGGGIACGASRCPAGQVCCIDCDGTGSCSGPGGGCPGYACPPLDAGPGDAGPGIACGELTCSPGQICCIDCDGRGMCGPPGTACPGLACLDAGTPPRPCPEGTCIVADDGPCEEPTGPTGNGCCACGAEGYCTEFCRCAAPDTPIATPRGERAIADLEVGDLVFSVDRGEVVAVPVVRLHSSPARDHVVTRVELDDGRLLEVSPGHPTADGRLFRDLGPGDALGAARVASARLVPYAHEQTYDILPASDTGSYFAAGALVGSTLARDGAMCAPTP